MAIFRKSQQTPAGTPTVVLRVPGRKRRLLVGSEYYPAAYRGMRADAVVPVELVPEPANQHDPNAVAGWMNGNLAGYLSRGPAAQYQPLIRQANALGYRVIVDGKVERINGTLAASTQMPEPRDFANWLAQPAEVRALGFNA